MAQSLDKKLETLEARERAVARKVATEEMATAERAALMEAIRRRRRSSLSRFRDSATRSWTALALGGKSLKVFNPRQAAQDPIVLGKVTTIPKIARENLSEIEIDPIREHFAFVRIQFNTVENEYFYEAIEPDLIEEEDELLRVIKEILVDFLEILGEKVPVKAREQYMRKVIDQVLFELGVEIHPVSKERIIYFILRDFMRFGPIDVPMTDLNVEDISCDGVNVPIYIYHRKYGSIPSNIRFASDEELDGFVVWLAQKSGKHVSVAQPMLDATMPDGSRLNATLGKHVTKRGSSFTVRRFKENPFHPLDLVRFKTMSEEMMAYLWLTIETGHSMLICGGTASGKTTTLNAVLLFIPPQMKIVSIEDTRELNLPHENWVPLLTRAGFGEKSAATGRAAGEIDMFDLLTTALRQRPQYLMVGEVRGAEAFVVFQAMATGKSAYTTFHADDVQSMVHRLENDPINLPRALVASLDVVLLQAQVKVGRDMTRRVKGLVEIVAVDPESNELITNSAYTWNPADDTFNYSGHSYVYENVMVARNWTQKRMELEMKRRVDVFRYMRAIGVNNYREVARIISTYYKDAEAYHKLVRETLDAKGIA